MSRKRKMTPAEKAAARWEPSVDAPMPESSDEGSPSAGDDEPANGDHFVISLVLIGIVAIAAIIFTVMQGAQPF